VFATPLTIAEYVSGLVLSSVATSTVGLLVMIALATAAFGLPFAAYGLVLVPALLVLFLFGIALGIAGSAVVLRLGPAAEWLIWPIPAVLSPFAGVFYPVATLPAWMQALSWVLPPSYVFEALRALLAGGPVPWASLGWAGLLALGDVVLAGWIFARVHRHAVRTGLVARYSAESVS
jgi:ABC-2 type transport system permease protein